MRTLFAPMGMGDMKHPLVTIGITCYNNQRHIKESLDSVLGQSWPDLEIIVVDDCSSDRSVELINSYSSKIKLIQHETNSGGLLQGRLDVLAAATGSFVAHLDADDFLEAEFVSRQMAEFEENPELDWVAANVSIVEFGGFYEVWPVHSGSGDVGRFIDRLFGQEKESGASCTAKARPAGHSGFYLRSQGGSS